MSRLILNDTVVFTDEWLTSTMQGGEMWEATGTVIETLPTRPQVVRVRWEGGKTWSVLAKNLDVIDRPGPDTCACGDYEWGACHHGPCWTQYQEERNSV